MKCIGFCEKDKFAVKSYRAMYDTEGEWYSDDIEKLKPTDIPRADIWTAGSPCQDCSISNRERKGLHGSRSGLFFKFTELLKGKAEEDKPEWIILENVKNLLSSNKGFDFLEYLSELDESGYDLEWQVFNSKYYLPQNRERVYTVGHLRSRGRREILPIARKSKATVKQIVGGSQGYRVYDPSGLSVTLASNAGGVGAKTGLYLIDQSAIAPKITEDARCITARYTAGIVNRTAMNSAVMEVSGANLGKCVEYKGGKCTHKTAYTEGVLSPARFQ